MEQDGQAQSSQEAFRELLENSERIEQEATDARSLRKENEILKKENEMRWFAAKNKSKSRSFPAVTQYAAICATVNCVTKMMASNNARPAEKTSWQCTTFFYETVGTYLGYGVAGSEEFYKIDHVMILGRKRKGKGRDFMLEQAKVLDEEFPELQALPELK